jgi:hypothetical protein
MDSPSNPQRKAIYTVQIKSELIVASVCIYLNFLAPLRERKIQKPWQRGVPISSGS